MSCLHGMTDKARYRILRDSNNDKKFVSLSDNFNKLLQILNLFFIEILIESFQNKNLNQ